MSALADKLAAAKSAAQDVLEAWPEEAYGSGKLEQAVALMGECVDELDRIGGDL